MRPQLRFVTTLAGAAAGAMAAFLLDPQNGRRRRTQAIDRTAGTIRRTARLATRTGRGATAELDGQRRRVMHAMSGEHRPVANEQTLADRVRSELFRDAAMPKGSLNINVERECVVVLRGEVQRPEIIGAIERKVRAIPGVRDVENLLHTPDTPATMHT
jgi:gas vesicle protein